VRWQTEWPHWVLLLMLPRVDPARANYAEFKGAYSVIRLAVLAVVVAPSASGALSVRADGLVYVLVGALLAVIGAVRGQIRLNLCSKKG
jgi:hypothetical protein